MASIWDNYDAGREPAGVWAEFDAKQPGEFRKGLSAGVDQLQAIGGGAAGLIGSAVGAQGLRDWGLDVYQRNQQEAAENAPKVGDVTEIKSVGEAKDWLVYQVANQLPILLGTLGAGSVGGLIGRKVAEKSIEAGIKGAAASALERRAGELAAGGMAEPLAARTAAKEIADEIAAKGMQAGALAGAGAASYGIESGSIYGDINEKTGQDRPGVAAAFAAPAAVLDVLPIGMVFKRMGIGETAKQGIEKILARDGWASAIAKQTAAEGVTEGLQTIVERAAVQWVDDNEKVFTPDGWNEIINAVAAGGALGGVTGAAGKALEGRGRADSTRELVARLQAGSQAATARGREQATADGVTRIGQATSIDEAIAHATSATSGARRAELSPMFESDVASSPVEGLIGGEMDQAMPRAERMLREQPAYDQVAQAKQTELDAMVDQRRDVEADAATQESLRAEREAAARPAAPANDAMRIAFEKATLRRMEALQAQKAAPAATIDAAAHQAAPSPQNERDEPTEGQKEAGNYKKGAVRLSGLAVSIENPEGSTRSGVGPDGKPWSNTLRDHYGYIKGVPARAPDKEHVDVFIKPGTPENFAGEVFVVDQNKDNGRFDEPKVMMGYGSIGEAREAYLRNYTPGWKGLRNISPMPLARFKEALLDPDSFKKPQPFTPQYYLDERGNRRRLEPGTSVSKGETVFTDLQAVDKERRRRLMDRRTADPGRDSLNEWIAKCGGLDIAERLDTIGDDQNQSFNASQWLFRHGGEKVDELARRAHEDGYLTDAEAGDVDGGVQALKDKIRDEFGGTRRHYSHVNTTVLGDQAKADAEAELMRDADRFGIPTEGLELDDIRKAVRQRDETEAALQETEADREARLEREAIQADNLIPEEQHDDLDFPDDQQGARQGEDAPGRSDEAARAQSLGEDQAEVDARPAEPARGDQAAAGERREADEAGALNERGDPKNAGVQPAEKGRQVGSQSRPEPRGDAARDRGTDRGGLAGDSGERSIARPGGAGSENAQRPDRAGGAPSGEARPRLDLKAQTESDLRAKEEQAAKGTAEERAAAQRDRNDAILTPPAGTAPARETKPEPTQQGGLFGAEQAQPVYDLDEDGPRLVGDRVAIVQPSKWESRGDLTYYEHLILDLKARKVVGNVTLGWRGGKVGQLLNVRIFGGNQTKGLGEAVVRTILEQNGDAELHVAFIASGAREFWRKMGVRFFETEEGEDGVASLQTYRAARPGEAGAATQPEGAAAARPEGAREGGRAGGEAQAQVDRAEEVSAPAPGRPGSQRPEEASKQLDLFAATPVPGTPAKVVEKFVVEPARRGTIKVAYEKIDTAEKAAHVFAGLRKAPREHFQMLGVDDNYKPVAFFDLFAGTITQTPVYPREVWTHLYQTPGVRKVWLAHNHPSGTTQPSSADERLNSRLGRGLSKDSGVEMLGHVIIAGRYAVEFGGDGQNRFEIPAAVRKFEVPILERTVRKSSEPGPALTSPDTVRDAVRALKLSESGLIFMDAQRRMLGFWPMPLAEMGKLRSADMESGFAKLTRQVGRSNAAGAIVYAPASIEAVGQVTRNIGTALRNLDAKLLDAFARDPGNPNALVSLAERGTADFGSDDDPFFRRGTTPGGAGAGAAAVRRELAGAFNAKGIQALEDSGVLELTTSADKRLDPIRERMAGTEDAVHWKGKAWFLTDRMAPGQAANRLLHELGEHHGLEGMLGKAGYAKLLARVDTMHKGGNAAVRDAWAHVAEAYEYKEGSPEFLSEVIAALTEDARVEKQDWWRELLDAIKAWLAKRGLGVKDEKDILALLRASVRKVMRDAEEPAFAGKAQPAFSRAEPAPLWYSALEHQVRDLKQGSAPAAQWKGTIKALKGISKDEIEWSGVNEWLDMQEGKVSKEALLGYLRENGVKVEETVLGEGDRAATSERDRLVVELDSLGYSIQTVPDVHTGEDVLDGITHRQSGYTYPIDGEGLQVHMAGVQPENLDDDGNPKQETAPPVPERVQRIVERLGELEPDLPTRDGSTTRYADYTLPGGENYRELLLTLPDARWNRHQELNAEYMKIKDDAAKRLGRDIRNLLDERDRGHLNESELGRLAENEVASADNNQNGKAPFKSSHFDKPNILAHVRFNERTDAEGKRVLFIEEIQSDWAQKGKREGFQQTPITELPENFRIGKDGSASWNVWGPDDRPYATGSVNREQAVRNALSYLNDLRKGVPSAPFVGKTEAWVGLALKRMVRYAAENGFDRVAWTTGEQQADRYDLAKHVRSLMYTTHKHLLIIPHGEKRGRGNREGWIEIGRDVGEEKLADYVGKDAAEKLNAMPWREHGGVQAKRLDGLDLHVGGEGMHAFYNDVLPKIANRLLEKMGGGRVAKFDMLEVLESGHAAEREPTKDQPGFDITPEMRSAAMSGMPMFSRPAIAASRTTGDYRDVASSGSNSFVRDLLHSDASFNWWHKSIGTQQHKALSNADFKRVYDESQAFLADVSKYANEAADNATSLLPRIEGFADFKKSTPSKEDIEGATQALYAGTLWGGGSPMEGRVWTDEELRSGRARDGKLSVEAFKPLNDKQIELYRQSIASIGKSLDELGKSLIHRLARQHDIGFDRGFGLEDAATSVRDQADAMIETRNDQVETMQDPQYVAMLQDQAAGAARGTRAAESARRDVQRNLDRDVARIEREIKELETLKRGVDDIEQKASALKDHGYFPAMRFGQFAVHVVRDVQGSDTPEQLYFGLFESQTKANLAARELEREFPGARIERGIISKEQHRLFQGMSLDALETFADYITGDDGAPLAKNPLVQGFLKAAVAERSSLKRHIHRKGIAGYSDDLPRVLASFTVSSARTTSSNYHMAEMHRLAGDIKAGDVKDEAIKLVTYLRDPQEEAQALRGFLFAQFLGGSIAHGLVNMTQPFMVTIPYLSQHTSAADAVAKVTAAAGTRPDKLSGRIRDAYDRARKEGVVAPQEIHQLRAETGGLPLAKNLALRKLSFLWGSIYAVTEQFNRSTAFLAAYRVAEAKGMDDPYTFAANAVNETQFVYNKGNRPNWARGPVGATVFTFKQFSISYLELGKRIFARDRKAFALMALALLAGAGVQGLPFAEDLQDLIDTIGQWMGFATNTKKALRKWATEQLGAEMAQVVLHGVSGFSWMPVDVSVRLGLQNLIPGTGMLKLSEDNKARDVLELVGPIGQFVPTDDTMAGRALERISKGDFGGALKSGAPVAIQNVVKGAEMLSTGEARDTKGKKILNVTPAESVLKMAGLQPASVARASEKVSAVMQDINLQKRMESEVAEQWARGIVDARPEEINGAVNKLMAWNRDNPELRIKVTSEQIRSRVKSMRTSREDRIVKSAPPEIRAGVRGELR